MRDGEPNGGYGDDVTCFSLQKYKGANYLMGDHGCGTGFYYICETGEFTYLTNLPEANGNSQLADSCWATRSACIG